MRGDTGAVRTRPRWLVSGHLVVLVAALVAARCQGSGVNATWYQFSVIRVALARYYERTAELPDSLETLCPGPECGLLHRDQRFDDGWRIKIRYQRVDGEYELASAGPDRVHGSRDDIVVRPSRERAFVFGTAGCYSGMFPVFGDDARAAAGLHLDTTPVRPGSYGGTIMGDSVPIRWFPLNADSLVVEWNESVDVIELRLAVLGTGSLSGTAFEFGESSTPRRVVPVVLARRPC